MGRLEGAYLSDTGAKEDTMALHNELDKHVKAVAGSSGYSVSGLNATITGSLDARQLEELIDKAVVTKHEVVVVSGVVTVRPRQTSY